MDVNNSVVDKRWKVIKRIAEGSFDSIYYEVMDMTNTTNAYALKVESNLPCKPELPPHFNQEEVKLWQTLKTMKASHFPGFERNGQVGQITYIVLGAFGKNMDDVRHQMPRQRFSLRTVIHVANESLHCIEEIHNARFVHRDVKPHNMVLGRPPRNQRRIYLVNFEMSRKYINEKGEFLPPASPALYRGTPRYSSVNALRYREQGRVDDMWAWFFSILEMTFGKMPIRDDNGPQDTEKYLQWLADQKQKGVDNPGLYVDHAPSLYRKIIDHIAKLEFHDKPDYALCHQVLEELFKSKGYTQETLLDWDASAEMKAFVA